MTSLTPRATWATWDARRRALALLVVGSVVLAVGAWGVSLAIESPREAAANASAPHPSLITVPVEERRVGEEIVTRGTVGASQTVEAVTEFAGSGADRALVSGRLPAPGDTIDHGSVVVEISGRPVIALRGEVPAYRALSLGDSGNDVRQLNAALAAAGRDVDEKSKSFTVATRTGLQAVYRDAGYSSSGVLPIGEVVFVSALPATIVAVTGTLGGSTADASAQIASGELSITPQFSASESALVQDGAEVVISSELLGKSVSGRVEGAGGTLVVPDERLSSAWAGQDVKVRVVSAETAAEVLAVPVTAIFGDASGETHVVVVRSGATTITDADPRRVPVTVGVIGGGWVEVTPADGEDLVAGDPVQLSAAHP